ncbi:hypothetical protein MVEN_01039400 [Mycena venus]|uniref:Uncharacterized protein n=1 Tax=Mycena venus TaxID=2733690 RepID=A0A8H7D351_9AGAR|nr:hypothetical protein MVEN_01039400 [Mycena venus]
MDSGTDEDSFLRAQVWGLFLQSLTFGVYLVTCGFCYPVFFQTTSRARGFSEINWPMLTIFFIFLAKTTSSVAVHVHLNLQSIVIQDHSAAISQFKDGSSINESKYITVLVQTVMASAFFIYRCWLVRSRSWLTVALPVVLWFGAVALMGIVIHIYTTRDIMGIFGMSPSKVFGACFWAVIIAVNIITTGQIGYRVCRTDHVMNRFNMQTDSDDSMSPTIKQKPSVSIFTGNPRNTIKHAICVAIQSGLINTTMTVVVFFLFVTNSVAVYTAIDVLVQMIGISFNLIIIQNRPRPQTSSQLDLNNSVPLQFTSSNMSVPGSAIEFAYPKYFTPRRKTRPTSGLAKEEVISQSSLSPDTAGIPQNHSQQSIQ